MYQQDYFLCNIIILLERTKDRQTERDRPVAVGKMTRLLTIGDRGFSKVFFVIDPRGVPGASLCSSGARQRTLETHLPP